MAKLSARGRTVLTQLSRTDGFGRHQYAFMSDGEVLVKTTHEGGNSTGWKVAKLPDGMTLVQAREKLIRNGYTEVIKV